MNETEGENQGKLPKNFALKSKNNEKYLRFIHDDKVLRGFLQFSGTKVVSPYSKFEVQDSKTKKGFVHIRCSYNNKYWVRWSARSRYIVASATEPDEDQSKFSCTLFHPIYDHDKSAFRFKHVQLDHYLSLRSYAVEPDFEDCLFAYGKGVEYDDSDLMTVVDWDSLFILPKHVAFKGDNGRYLRAHSSGTRYLQFDESDIGHPSVGNEIFTTPDGYCRIKNDQVGKFWMRDPNWIHAKATKDNFDDPNTLFWPVRLDNSNGVALRNMGNHRFCKRLSVEGKTNCLNAAVDSITKEARLEIEELVLQRSIYDVNFRLLDARIYGETPMTMTKGEIVNKNSEAEKSKLKLRYEESRESTWSNSVGVKLGMKISIESGVPEISTQEFEMSAEIKEEHMYGETKVTKTRTEVEHEVVVPPNTRVLAKVLATKGFCDIPYSYTQRDVLTNGKVVVQHFDDGIYTGVNTYNYTFLTEQEAL